MKVALLTSEKNVSCDSPLIQLSDCLSSRGIDSQVVSTCVISPDISWLDDYDLVIARIVGREYLWLVQYLEEMGIRVINSHRALSVSSNKLISDEIMKQSGLRTPRTVFVLKEKIPESTDSSLFPALVKPLYGRSRGILYVESIEKLKNLRRKWMYLQKFVPNNGGVTRIYKIGHVVRAFFHPNEGKAREVRVPDEIMEGALRCFSRMDMKIGGMDFVEGEDGYYALEVNDFPAGVKRIENWSRIIAGQVVEGIQRHREEMESYDLEKGMELTGEVSQA